MTDREILNAQWLTQKYEYYLAGRTLWLNNQMQMGALMLAYAIEAQIKHALVIFDNNCPRKLRDSGHDIPQLFKEAQKAKIFEGISVDDNFLNFVQDNFERRYPRQTRERGKKANSEGRGLAITSNILPWYDKLVLSLDQWIYTKTSDFKLTIKLEAVKKLDSKGGHYFFDRNNTAFNSFPEILELLEIEVNQYENNLGGSDKYQVHIESLNKIKDKVINIVNSLDSPLPYPEVDQTDFTHPGQFEVFHTISIQL
jgi:hypothetical protein